MSIKIIYERAPIGAIIRFTDSAAQPEAKDTEALVAWRKRNGTGRFVQRTPSHTDIICASSCAIVLQQDGPPTDTEAAMLSRQVFWLDSDLSFQIIDRPVPGNVRVIQHRSWNTTLLHLAKCRDDAERWVKESGLADLHLEDVTVDEICADFVEGRAA